MWINIVLKLYCLSINENYVNGRDKEVTVSVGTRGHWQSGIFRGSAGRVR